MLYCLDLPCIQDVQLARKKMIGEEVAKEPGHWWTFRYLTHAESTRMPPMVDRFENWPPSFESMLRRPDD